MSLVIFWNKIEVSLNSLDSKNVFVLVLAHLQPELEPARGQVEEGDEGRGEGDKKD